MTRNATSEYLVREALTLLLDDPTPRNVAQAMGPAHAQELLLESQTEHSEESDLSQLSMAVAKSTKRQMLVRITKSTDRMITVVDRSFSIDAYISPEVTKAVLAKQGFQLLSRLRGLTIGVDKYFFSTPAHCRALAHGSSVAALEQEDSVSTRSARRGISQLCMFIESFSITDLTSVAVNPLPDLEEHDAIAKQLAAMTSDALLNRLMLRQGLSLIASLSGENGQVRTKQFDDHNPLLDEDCEIPEDQERELDEQDGWGGVDPEPTASQLIAENGPVARTDSQVSGNANTSFSNSGNTVVSSTQGASPPNREPIVVLETEPHSFDDHSVPDTQDGQFLRENLQDAFMEVSDTDSDDEEKEDEAAVPVEPMTQPPSSPTPASNPDSSLAPQVDEAASTDALNEDLQPSAEAPLSNESTTSSESQAPGKFVGEVALDYDEPMTQQPDESQLTSQLPSTQADDGASQFYHPASVDPVTQQPDALSDVASHDEAEDVDFGAPSEDVSQQDGQADHWMQTQPEDPTRTQEANRPTQTLIDPTQHSVTERRKRKRSLAPEDRHLSPQGSAAREQRSARPPLSKQPSSRRSSASGIDDSSIGEGDTTARRPIFGISSFNKKSRSGQQSTERPSKRYQHLLPPFDYDAFEQQLTTKTN